MLILLKDHEILSFDLLLSIYQSQLQAAGDGGKVSETPEQDGDMADVSKEVEREVEKEVNEADAGGLTLHPGYNTV